MSRTSGLALRLVSPLLLAPLCAGQSPSIYFRALDPLPWPTGASGSVSRSAVGDFTADGVRDVVFLIGSTATLVYNPDACGWTSPIALSNGARDMDTVPRAGSDNFERLAIVDGDGLKRVDLHVLGSAPSVSLLESSSWANGRAVRCGDVDHDGVCDYVGIGFDRTKLLVTTCASDPLTTSVFTLSDPIGEAVLLDFHGNSDLEIALMTFSGVELRNRDGTLVWSAPMVAPRGDTIVAFRPPGSTKQALAWVRKAVGGQTEELLTFEDSGTPSSPTIRTTALTWNGDFVYGAAAADVHVPSEGTGDLDDDLALFDKTSFIPQLYFDSPPSGSGPYFSNSFSMRPTLPEGLDTSAPGSNFGRPAFGDLNGDGLADLFVPVQGQGFSFLQGTTMSGPPVVATEGFEVLRGCRKVTTGTTGTVSFSLKLSLQDLRGNDTTYTHLNLVCWRQSDVSGAFTLQFNHVFALPQSGPPSEPDAFYPMFPLTISALESVSFSCQSPEPLHDVYWLEMRAVRAPNFAFTGIQSAGPTWIAFLTYDSDKFCSVAGSAWNFYELHVPGDEIATTTCQGDDCTSSLSPRPVRMPAIKRRRTLPPGGTGSAGNPTLLSTFDPDQNY
jgi:hypothetical protein